VARLKLAQGDVSDAAAVLDEAEAFVRRYNFVFRMPDVAGAQVLLLLHQGHLAAAAHLAHLHDLPISQARVHLAQGDPSAALSVLEPWRLQVESKGWQDERLKVMVLQAIALQAYGERPLESGDVRAAIPRPGHGERTQSENLWQATSPTAH